MGVSRVGPGFPENELVEFLVFTVGDPQELTGSNSLSARDPHP